MLAGGSWPGMPIPYTKGNCFRVLVENRLDQPTSLSWPRFHPRSRLTALG